MYVDMFNLTFLINSWHPLGGLSHSVIMVVRCKCIHRSVLVANHFATHFILTNTITGKMTE